MRGRATSDTRSRETTNTSLWQVITLETWRDVSLAATRAGASSYNVHSNQGHCGAGERYAYKVPGGRECVVAGTAGTDTSFYYWGSL